MNIAEEESQIPVVARLIAQSQHLVAFSGAGISTESGIPDFRGPDGVWTRRDQGKPPPHASKPLHLIEPNVAHNSLVILQQIGLLKFLISQNVDNLHLKSGISPQRLAELHGNHTLMRCLRCDKSFPQNGLWDENKWGKGYRTQPIQPGQPSCPECHGRLISSIVNFGDPLPKRELELADEHTRLSDVFLVIGSSLLVMPAAALPLRAKKHGAVLIIINHQSTPLDKEADFRFFASAGVILPKILCELEKGK